MRVHGCNDPMRKATCSITQYDEDGPWELEIPGLPGLIHIPVKLCPYCGERLPEAKVQIEATASEWYGLLDALESQPYEVSMRDDWSKRIRARIGRGR